MSSGSAPLAAPSETTAEGGPILPTVPVADPVGPKVVAAPPDGPLRSDPVSQEMVVEVFPLTVNGETAASATKVVVTPAVPAADLPGSIATLERTSAVAGASCALVPFRSLPGSRYPEASQGVPIGGSPRASGFTSAFLGSVAAAPESAGEATVWKDVLFDVASTSTMLRALADTLDSKPPRQHPAARPPPSFG